MTTKHPEKIRYQELREERERQRKEASARRREGMEWLPGVGGAGMWRERREPEPIPEAVAPPAGEPRPGAAKLPPERRIISTREMHERDLAWQGWWNELSATGQYPAEPTDPYLKPYYEQFLTKAAEVELPPIEPVEPIKTEAPTPDVQEKAELYGLYEGYFLNEQQLLELAKRPEERDPRFRLPYEQYLTWEQARYLGLDVAEGALVKVTPMAEGEPQFTLVSSRAEVPQIKEELEDTLRAVYPEMFDPSRSYGYSPEKIPSMVVEQLGIRIQEDFQGFVDDLYTRVGEFEAERLLKLFGVTEEIILQSLDFEKQEERVTDTIQAVFPEYSIDDLGTLLETDFSMFIETIQTGDSSAGKRKLLQEMGYKPDEINQILSKQRLVLDLDGVSQQVTVDIETQTAYDAMGNYVGKYNPATKQFTKAPEESVLKDFWDWTMFQGRTMWEQGENFMLSVVPEIIFADIPKERWKRHAVEQLFTDEMVDFANENRREMRENFRWLYGENKAEYDQWVKGHPELLAPVNYQEGAFQHPELLKDPSYYAYELANIIPFIVTVAGVSVATGGVGLPFVLGTTAIMAPIEGQAVYEDLINAGAPEPNAAPMAAIAGVLIGLLESAGRIPLLKQVSPLLFGQFKKQAASQLAKRGLADAVKKFGRAFTISQFSEITTEVAQEVISNIAVSFYDKNRSILENLPDIAVKTAVATILPSGFGAGVSVRMVSRNEQQGLTDIAKKAKGWVQDNKGNWFEKLKEQRGAVRLPGEPEEVRPISEIQKDMEQGKQLSREDIIRWQDFIDKTQAEKRTAQLAEDVWVDQRTRELIQVEGLSRQDAMAKAKQEYKAPTPPVAPALVARPEPGMPEAGIQAGMLGVPAEEVRPVGIGKVTQISMEDQLKLEEVRRQAEEAPDETREAYEAQAESEGLKYNLSVDPVATYRFQMGTKMVGLESLISIKEQMFPEYFTLKQAKALKPTGNWTIWEQKGLPTYNKIPFNFALDEMGDKWGMTADQIANRVMQIRKEKRRIRQLEADIRTTMTEKPLVPRTELTTAEVTDNWETIGKPKYTLAQAEDLCGFMGEYILSESTVTAFELQRALQSKERAEKFEKAKARTQELMVSQGLSFEDALIQSTKELSGKLKFVPTDYFEGMPEDLRDALFSVVYHKFDALGPRFIGEMYATVTALTNAIGKGEEKGRAIPRKKGRPTPGSATSELFPEGGSAWDRLNFIFGKQPKVLKSIEKMAEENKSLQDVVEGVFHETNRAPIPIDEETADYLRSLLNIPFGYKTLLEEPWVPPPPLPPDTRTKSQKAIDLQNFKLEITPDIWKDWSPERLELLSYLRVNLLKEEYQAKLIEEKWIPPPPIKDVRTPAQRAIDLVLLKIELAPKPIPVTKFDAPIEKAFKQPAFKDWTFMEKKMLVKVLKDAGWVVVDIANLMRALKTTLDNSFLRQAKALAGGHPLVGFKGHNVSWRAMFNQSVAEATWERIIKRPWFPIYEQNRIERGDDPLRVPAFAATKGTKQYRYSEEFGFAAQQADRWIPRMTAKLPIIKPFERAFSAGTNEIVAGLMDIKYEETLRRNEKIASGEITLKEGEAFDIVQEMGDHQAFLANMIQRATLPERARGLAPVFNAFFFALRSKLGRFFAPIHLTGLSIRNKQVRFNPRVMKEAWRDFILTNAGISGIMFLGSWLGLWDLEDDPRNAEFMSARIGNTRIDPWAGQRQFVVLYARLVTKTGISSVTGAEYEVNPPGAVGNFIQNSLSPMASILLEFWTGRNFLGQVIDFADAEYWVEKITAMSLWDIWEAFRDEGWGRAAQVTIPAIYGEGVQTYTGDWKENHTKLGIPKYLENAGEGADVIKYDAGDFWSDHASDFKGVDPETLTAKKGFPAYIKAMAEAYQTMETTDFLPNEKLILINADPMKGGVKTPTFVDYHDMWLERQKLVDAGDEAEYIINEQQPDGKYKKVTYKGEEAVEAFDKKEGQEPSKSRLGNISQTQFVLLTDYWTADEKKQKEMLEKYPELGQNPYHEYYKSRPKENAILAVHGKMDVLTEEAYKLAVQMAKEWDYPDSAVSPYLPPKDIAKPHFERIGIVEEFGANSWEDKLFRAKNGDWLEWENKRRIAKGEDPLGKIDTPIAALELKTEKTYREIWHKLDDKDYLNTLDDKKKVDGLTEREKYIADLKATKIGDMTYVDIDRKIKALEKGTEEAPIPEEVVDGHVEYMRILDQEGIDFEMAEANLYRIDNDVYNQSRLNKDLWGTDAFNEDVDRTQEAKWRLQVASRSQEKDYKAISQGYTDMSNVGINAMAVPEGMNPEAWGLKTAEQKRSWLSRRDEASYLESDPDYAEARLRIGAYQFGLTDIQDAQGLSNVDKWVTFNQLPLYGAWRGRFQADDPDFFKAVTDLQKAKGVKPWDAPGKMPSIQYDNIYEEWKDDFEKWDSYEDPESLNFIADPDARELARYDMRFKVTVQNYSGVKARNEELTAFGMARYKREAYKNFVPEEYVNDYVGYYKIDSEGKPEDWKLQSGTELWFEDDWYMMEHMEFYQKIYKGLLGNKPIPFRGGSNEVPTRFVFEKYLRYVNLPHQKAKDDYRYNNRALDQWGQERFDWTPILEKERREELSPFERFAETLPIEDIEKKLRERRLRR